jgi:RNA polymerase sigma-70 factor (ECF subfamily)
MELAFEQRELLGAFLSARSRTLQGEAERATLADVLMVSVNQAHSAWAELNWPISRRAFARYLGELLAEDGGDVAATLSGLHVGDLLLACACTLEIPSALETFDKLFLRHLGSLPYQFVSIDDLRQVIREKLLVGAADGQPKIRSYSGRGRLASWVAIAARRTALSLARSKGPPVETLSTTDLQEIMLASSNSEIAYMKAEHRSELQEALRTALSELSERDRLILRLQVIDGISLERIGIVYKVHPSTVSRWLNAARSTVRARVEHLMAEQLGMAPEEVVSVAGLLASDFDLSLARLLDE